MHPPRLPRSLLLLALLPVAPVSATIVLQDTFADGDRTANPAWYRTEGTSTSLATTFPETGVLAIGSSNSNLSIALSTTFSPVTLAQAGDLLRYTVVLRYSDPGSTQIDSRAREFTVGIGSSAGTPPTGNGTGEAGDDVGYVMALGGSTSGSTGSSILVDLGDRTDPFTTGWLGSTDTEILESGPFVATEVFKTFTMTITRDAGGLFDIEVTDGSVAIAASNVTPVTTTFDLLTIGFYNRSTINTLQIDSATVEFVAVPEPGSIAFLAAGAAFVLVFFRARRRA